MKNVSKRRKYRMGEKEKEREFDLLDVLFGEFTLIVRTDLLLDSSFQQRQFAEQRLVLLLSLDDVHLGEDFRSPKRRRRRIVVLQCLEWPVAVEYRWNWALISRSILLSSCPCDRAVRRHSLSSRRSAPLDS